jgi:hypothetical protein
VAAAAVAIATLLAQMNPRLEFHKEDRGCIFDFNDERDTIVLGLRDLKIEDVCLRKMEKRYRDAAVAMVKSLHTYHG